MSRFTEKKLPAKLFCHTSKGMAAFSVFILSFLLLSPYLWSQDVAITTPDYLWLNQVDLPTIISGDLNYDDLTIAIATGPQGNVYTLTFGKGVDKRDSDGNLLQTGFIAASQLDSPRDIAVDDQGYIYIADYIAGGDTFLDDGKIRVFDLNGNYLTDQTIFTSFYRPLGLDILGNKIYVAEYYDGLQGPEKGSTFSRIRIYDKVTKAVLKENMQGVVVPLRIAVDSYENIYVSQAGNNDPSVTVFNSSLQVMGELPGIVSPGSILVDDFDFIHVIEYGSHFDFSDFINFETLAFGDILDISEAMMLGIQNEEFFIKVYRPDKTLTNTLLDHVDFPVDLAMNSCEKFYIDNTTIFGSYIPFLGYTPSRLEFDLEIYKRTPTFDAAESPEITCGGNIEVVQIPGENYAIVEFPDAIATDNCSVAVIQTKGPGAGSQFPIGENIIEFTATDAAGNTATCSFSIIVNNNDLPPQFTDCPVNMELFSDTGKCGAVAIFDTPAATDELGGVEVNQIIGQPSGSLFPVGDTQVNFQAIDEQGNTSNCSFTISVSDGESPVSDCPANLVDLVDFGVTGLIVEYADPVASDNCSGLSIEQIAGMPSGSSFPVGVTENIFLVTDASNNIATCSFTITIEENADAEDPVITCPASFSVPSTSDSCGALVNYSVPEATDNSGEVSLGHIAGPAPGEFFEIGPTMVTYRAVDAAGNSVNCSFTITVNDGQAPIIENCPGDQQEIIATEEFILPDYRNQLTISDCSANIVITQTPQPGTTISETTLVKITAEDEAGNISGECAFQVIIEKEALQITSCPSAKTVQIDGNCGFILPDYSAEVSTNHTSVIIQAPLPGTEVTADMNVLFTATDINGNSATCEMPVKLEDAEIPTITCPADKEFTFDPAHGFTVPDFTAEVVANDNCDFQVVQQPGPGTIIFNTQEVVLTATDTSRNQSSCNFYLSLTEVMPPAVQITSCPGFKTLNLNSGCTTEIPDLTGEISTNISADIVQSPEAGTLITENTSVVIIVTNANGNQDTCTVPIAVQDVTPPTIRSCPANKEFTFDPTDGFTVPDFTTEVVVEDHCSFEIVQEPGPGSVISKNNSEITFTVTDNSGNSSSCSFWLNLSEEVALEVSCPGAQQGELSSNCDYILPDFTTLGGVNFENAVITQEPQPGNILYSDSQITLTAALEGNYTSCSFDLILKDNRPPEVKCVSSLVLKLDNSGTANINPLDIDAGSTDNCDIFSRTLSRSLFTADDLGDQKVMLTVADASGNESSCESIIIIEAFEKPVSPVQCAATISLQLDENRSALLDPADLHTGESGSLQFTVSKEEFNCGDIGEQIILFSYITPSEEGSCQIKIIIEDPGGYCNLMVDEPIDPVPFVILYPNPGDGMVKIYTSADINLKMAEVFDMRGRFLFAKNLSDTSSNLYSVDLTMYQTGVYTIKLNGDDKEYVRRAIIRNN